VSPYLFDDAEPQTSQRLASPEVLDDPASRQGVLADEGVDAALRLLEDLPSAPIPMMAGGCRPV
jgi:hypothetical protein